MEDGLVEMVVESVRVHMLSSRHVVILKESERDRYLPIWIGQSEANAIAMRLQGISGERPLTDDERRDYSQRVLSAGIEMRELIDSARLD